MCFGEARIAGLEVQKLSAGQLVRLRVRLEESDEFKDFNRSKGSAAGPAISLEEFIQIDYKSQAGREEVRQGSGTMQGLQLQTQQQGPGDYKYLEEIATKSARQGAKGDRAIEDLLVRGA